VNTWGVQKGILGGGGGRDGDEGGESVAAG